MTCREYIENYDLIKEYGDDWRYYKKLEETNNVDEQSAQSFMMGTSQRLNRQGANNFMRRGYEYKITGQFKNAESGSITNQEAPSRENENPNLEITTHDFVLVKLHGQKMTLKIASVIGNEYVGEDNEGREYKFDKSQILRKINV